MTWKPPLYEDGSVLGEQTAAKMNEVTAQIVKLTEEIEAGGGAQPTIQCTLLSGNTAKKNTELLNAAIASLPGRGGVVELPRGQFLYEGANCKERSNVLIRGQGGQSGGGGLGGGVAGVNEASTTLADVRGTGAERSFDMRKGIACGLEKMQLTVFNEKWPTGAIIWDCTSQQLPQGEEVTVEATSENAAVKPIPNAWGLGLRGICNSGNFINLTAKGCQYSIAGPTAGGEEAVAHNFYNFTSYGHQAGAILNPYQGWNFFGGAIEEARNNKGALVGAAAVRTSIPCYSLHFYGTWIGGDKISKAETGVQIQWQGNDLLLDGGQLSNAETLIECIGACEKITVKGTYVALAKNGIKLQENVSRVLWEPTKPPAGIEEVTKAIVGTSAAANYQAKTVRATAKSFTPSEYGPTQLVLAIKCKAATQTKVELKINGKWAGEASTGVDASGVTVLHLAGYVPATQSWEVVVIEGTVEEMNSSYYFI